MFCEINCIFMKGPNLYSNRNFNSLINLATSMKSYSPDFLQFM